MTTQRDSKNEKSMAPHNGKAKGGQKGGQSRPSPYFQQSRAKGLCVGLVKIRAHEKGEPKTKVRDLHPNAHLQVLIKNVSIVVLGVMPLTIVIHYIQNVVLINISTTMMVKVKRDVGETWAKPQAKLWVKLMTKVKVTWPLHKINLLGSKFLINHQHGKPKVEGEEGNNTKLHKCTHIFKIKSFFKIFCVAKFVGSIDVPHNAHALKEKHHIVFPNPLK